METIIKKAIEGGWEGNPAVWSESIMMKSSFWQSLGKTCGWDEEYKEKYGIDTPNFFIGYAMRFHEINLTEGWEKAVEYLQEITK